MSNRTATPTRPAVGEDSRTVDAESRRVIREELLTNILVEAGAGSGKTQMLAERMAAGIAAGVYEIEHLAAVTFTRKAASELRGRFHLALEKERAGARDPERIARLEHALGNLERFFAGTIHSFCARLLRERPVESGVSPGFTELDEVQDLELRKRAWRDFVTSARSAGDPDMLALLDADVKPSDLDAAFSRLCEYEDVEFPAGDAECPDPKPALKALEKFWKELKKYLPEPLDTQTTCGFQKAAREYGGQLRVNRNRLDRPSVVASMVRTWDKELEFRLYPWAATRAEQYRIREKVLPLHAALRAEVGPWLSQWRQYVYRLSVELLTRAREWAAAERRRANALNYNDLLILTARVLRTNTEVRRALQQKYRFLFVDEFQDTDPVQAQIVFLLAGDETRAPDRSPTSNSQPSRCSTAAASRVLGVGSWELGVDCDWRSVPLRSGALFVVGDPKQSIYRFRRADIDIYNIVRARLSDPAVGRVLPLTMNFRSVPELCEWANGVFEGPFPAEPTAHSPQFAALDAAKKSRNPHGAGLPPQGGPLSARSSRISSRSAGLQACLADSRSAGLEASQRSGLFTLTHDCDKSELADADADRIATYIQSEVEEGRRRYSDFLILTRKKRDRIVPYVRALEALNIPIEVSGAGAFGESAEVEALTVLLRALADPQDALSLIAVLRGSLFGISDRELFAFRQSGGWFGLTQAPVAQGFSPALTQAPVAQGFSPAPPVARVTSALESLGTYYRWTRLMPAAAALDRILEHTGNLALAATTPGGVNAGDLVHAVDRVRQVVEDGGSLADAAQSLEDDREAASEVESLPLQPGLTDVVRVMNLHKAKGLEADVVFLADPCGGPWARDPEIHIRRVGDPPTAETSVAQAFRPASAYAAAQGWFRVVRIKEGQYNGTLLAEPLDWDKYKEAERPYLEAETTRLLYVAATRAREMLVVSRFAGKNGKPAWGLLNDHLATARELPKPRKVDAPVVHPLDVSARAQAAAEAQRTTAHDAVRGPSWSITSVTAEARHIARMTRSAEPSADDPSKIVTTDTPTHRADAGMAWGVLIHGLLEHAMRHQDATREDLRRLALWLTFDEPSLRSVIDVAIDTVQSVAAAGFWREAKSSEHSEETPFTFAVGRRLVMGVIDLIHRAAEGWRITDYKTDADGGVVNAAKYGAQVEWYGQALEACGVKVEGAALESVRATSN
jgi:ATP-dependent helicase/nuclease subunit A